MDYYSPYSAALICSWLSVALQKNPVQVPGCAEVSSIPRTIIPSFVVVVVENVPFKFS